MVFLGGRYSMQGCLRAAGGDALWSPGLVPGEVDGGSAELPESGEAVFDFFEDDFVRGAALRGHSDVDLDTLAADDTGC